MISSGFVPNALKSNQLVFLIHWPVSSKSYSIFVRFIFSDKFRGIYGSNILAGNDICWLVVPLLSQIMSLAVKLDPVWPSSDFDGNFEG